MFGMNLRSISAAVFAVAFFGIAVSHAQRAVLPDRRFFVDERPRARMEMGVSAGAVYMFASPSEGIELNPKMGVRGALSMALCWRERYAVRLELGYLFNKIEAGHGGAVYDVRSNVMEIPVLFSYRGLGPVRLNAGPVLSLAGTGRYDAGAERVEFGRLRTSLGYAVGAGVALSRHLTVEAGYTGCFGRTANYFEGVEFACAGRWVSLGLGYVF